MKILALLFLFTVNFYSSYAQKRDSIANNELEVYNEYSGNPKVKNSLPRHKISVSFGYSYKLNKIQDFSVNNEYLVGLQGGVYGEQSYIHYFNKRIGIGIKVNLSSTSTSKSSHFEVNIGNTGGKTGVWKRQSDNIVLAYLGPTFSYRILRPVSKITFYTNVSVGYQNLSHLSTVSFSPRIAPDIKDFKIITTGDAVGYSGEFGIDRTLSKWLSLGLKAEYISGTLKRVKSEGIIINLNDGFYENLNRFSISTGLRANF